MLSIILWNRLGLTARNIAALLDTEEDFELHMVDNNSRDGTWDYVQELSDKRIKSKTRFDKNRGPIYAVNYNLAKRKQAQYFITFDSDVCIHTKNWISKFMEVFDEFPKVGLLGVTKASPYIAYLPPVLFHIKNGISYLQLKNASLTDPSDFIPGHCQCLRPELIDLIGYWNEEGHFGDAEISPRIVQYTPYHVGYVTTVEIDQVQEIRCGDCAVNPLCKLGKTTETCFSLRDQYYKNPLFPKKYIWKHYQIFKEMKEGKRTAFSASIHDEESMKKHLYYMDWAEENFNFYE